MRLLLATAVGALLLAPAVVAQQIPHPMSHDATNAMLPDARNGLGLGTEHTPQFKGVTDASKYRLDGTGLSYGLGGIPMDPGNPVEVLNTYSGPALANNAVAIFGRTDYRPTSPDNSNTSGIYGNLWLNAPQTFTGVPSAIKGNIYAIAQIAVAVAAGGKSNVVGDTLTLVGGTCNTQLNQIPVFTVNAVDGGGAVTNATFAYGAGACSVYPTNPVVTTSSRAGAVPPTLNLTVSPTPTVSWATGLYGRVRNQSAGTINQAAAIYADGAYNSANGQINNAYSVYMRSPYTTTIAPVASFGLYADGEFRDGTIAAAVGVPISIKASGAGEIILRPGALATAYITDSEGLASPLTGSARDTGLYPYMTNLGKAYIDAITSGANTAELHLRTYDGSGAYSDGLVVAQGYAVLNKALLTTIPNATTTGTTVGKLAKLTGAPSTAVVTATSDTDGAVGIVVGTSGVDGISGNAQIAISGQTLCQFDGPTTAGNYVGYSTTVAGACKDVGASRPAHGIGRVLSTNAVTTNAVVLIHPF